MKRISKAAEFRRLMEGKSEELNPCPQSVDWVKNRSLVQAWRDCQCGSWMVYWLFNFCGVQMSAIRRVDGVYHYMTESRHTPGEQRAVADKLRQAFTPTGRRRQS